MPLVEETPDLGIEWDAENRLSTVKQGGNTLASFTYNGKGHRASKTGGGVTTTYVYSGANFLEERPSAGSTKRFVYGPGIDQPLAQVVGGTTTYNVADHLGSLVRATDNLGNPTFTREYDPWGNPLQGSATSGYAFTGREWDPETGLYYYRARYFDPQLARFISEDPLPSAKAFRGEAVVERTNLYAYVRNNSILYTDPLGLVRWKCEVGVFTVTPRFLGGGVMGATCRSECVGGTCVRVDLAGVMAGGARGIPVTAGHSNYEMVDSMGAPHKMNLEGGFVIRSVGVGIGPGSASCGDVILGSAVSTGSGCGVTPFGGFDGGAGGFSGVSIGKMRREPCCAAR